MPDDSYAGGCYCGAVRFVVSGTIKSCCFCHCESCRRAAGAAFVPWATFNKADFAVSAGSLTLHASSAEATRGHCARCGTSLTYEHAKRPTEIDIAVVSFDEPARFTPGSHIWIDDKLPWITIADDLPQHRTWASADAD